MREFHGRDAYDGTDTGADSGVDAPVRHAGDPRRPERAVVQDAEIRTALALAYRRRVETESATCGSEDAAPQGHQSRHSPATTGTEGDHAFCGPAERDADSRYADHHGKQVQRQDKAGGATQYAGLPPRARDLPDARDVIPNIRLAELVLVHGFEPLKQQEMVLQYAGVNSIGRSAII